MYFSIVKKVQKKKEGREKREEKRKGKERKGRGIIPVTHLIFRNIGISPSSFSRLEIKIHEFGNFLLSRLGGDKALLNKSENVNGYNPNRGQSGNTIKIANVYTYPLAQQLV